MRGKAGDLPTRACPARRQGRSVHSDCSSSVTQLLPKIEARAGPSLHRGQCRAPGDHVQPHAQGQRRSRGSTRRSARASPSQVPLAVNGPVMPAPPAVTYGSGGDALEGRDTGSPVRERRATSYPWRKATRTSVFWLFRQCLQGATDRPSRSNCRWCAIGAEPLKLGGHASACVLGTPR